MPRSASAILGFALVAFSIGFNTVHYPVVWEMVGPAKTSESVQTAAVAQPEQPKTPEPLPEPVPLPSRSAEAINMPRVPDLSDKSVADSRPSAEPAPAAGGAAVSERATADRSEATGQFVPIVPVSLPKAWGDQAASGAGIRRLPPVVQSDPNLANRDPGPPYDGSIPVYPTTGIE